MVPNIVP